MSTRLTPLIFDLVRQYGCEAGAFQILEPNYRWFVHRERGCVGYVDTGHAWIAAGSPIAPREELQEVAHAFVREASEKGRRACFFGAESSFVAGGSFQPLMLGQQFEWHPPTYATEKLRRSLRQQHQRARAKGVTSREVSPVELQTSTMLGRRVDRLVERWLTTRRMATLDFVVRVHPFWRMRAEYARWLRVFVAEREGKLMAAAILLPVFQRDGWFINHLLRDPEAPNGTIELLVHEVLQTLAREEAQFATLGLAPLSGGIHPTLRVLRRTLAGAFDFEGLARFKSKLSPTSESAIYLVHPEGTSATLALLDSLSAFAPQGRGKFAWATVRRQLELWRSTHFSPSAADRSLPPEANEPEPLAVS